MCPSKDLTTTPRQRIALRRQMAEAAAAGDVELLRELEADYAYDAVGTCAVDGMCAVACPVLINTGDLVRRLRAEATGPGSQALWRAAAARWPAVTRASGRGLDLASKLPPGLVEGTTRIARRVLDPDKIPQWSRDLPAGGRRRTPELVVEADAVYLPACLGTIFAPADGGMGATAAFTTLAARAGVRLHVPEAIAGLCCGSPWSSKGLPGGYALMQRRVLTTPRAATRGGVLPVVSDAVSCSGGRVRSFASAIQSLVQPRRSRRPPLGQETAYVCSAQHLHRKEGHRERRSHS